MKSMIEIYSKFLMYLNCFYRINKRLSMFTFISLMSSFSVFSQKVDDNPKFKYFENYLNTNSQYEMLKNSFPTLGECKLIFKDKYAITYFNWLNNLKEEYFDSLKTKDFLTDFGMIRYVYTNEEENIINTGDKNFNSVRYDSISTSEFREEWKIYYQPYIKIYRVVYINDIDDENGFEYNGFVSINNTWKFFPKPKRSIFNN